MTKVARDQVMFILALISSGLSVLIVVRLVVPSVFQELEVKYPVLVLYFSMGLAPVALVISGIADYWYRKTSKSAWMDACKAANLIAIGISAVGFIILCLFLLVVATFPHPN